jgi:hypothetical protein
VLEHALTADVALLRAEVADRAGNLAYRGAGRNFNVPMATAARRVIVEVQQVVPTGTLDPERVITPGLYVDPPPKFAGGLTLVVRFTAGSGEAGCAGTLACRVSTKVGSGRICGKTVSTATGTAACSTAGSSAGLSSAICGSATIPGEYDVVITK